MSLLINNVKLLNLNKQIGGLLLIRRLVYCKKVLHVIGNKSACVSQDKIYKNLLHHKIALITYHF